MIRNTLQIKILLGFHFKLILLNSPYYRVSCITTLTSYQNITKSKKFNKNFKKPRGFSISKKPFHSQCLRQMQNLY